MTEIFHSEKKACFKCRRRKPLRLFYRHPQMADGYIGKCRSCTRKDVRANRARRLEYYRAYDRARGGRNSERHRRLHPGKHRARTAVTNALRSGRLVRCPCVKCGEAKTQAHHPDYRKPLSIIWLCFTCHRSEHARRKEAA